MSINGGAIKTGGYASTPDENRCEAKRANLYLLSLFLPLYPLVLVPFRSRETMRSTSALANYSPSRVGIMRFVMCILCIFNLSSCPVYTIPRCFSMRKRINTYRRSCVSSKGNNSRSWQRVHVPPIRCILNNSVIFVSFNSSNLHTVTHVTEPHDSIV